MLGPYRTPGYAQVRQLRNLQPLGFGRLANAGVFGTIITAVLAIFLVAALIAPVANLTSGITLSHTGFTPSVNITGTPGLVSILQLFPLVFAFLGIAIGAKYFSEEARGI
jgi:hypothetical protein